MKILQFFKEGNGQFSSVRLALIVAVFVCLFVWSYLSLSTGQVQPFPVELAGFVGILGATKVVQKFTEEPKQETP